jgi:pimeloyl-ACP methyl ester carboxylesterase
VFLHGGGVAGWMWEPVVRLLQDYHCLAPDLPEHGQSATVRPFSMELAADKVAELIHAQAPAGKAALVGLSEGAQVGVQMLASAPEVMEWALVSSALLLPITGARLLSAPGLLSWTFRLSVPPFRNSDWWIRLNMKYSAAIPQAFFPQFKAGFQAMTESQFVNLMLANQRFRLPAGLEKVAIPTLAVAGKDEYGGDERLGAPPGSRPAQCTCHAVRPGERQLAAKAAQLGHDRPGSVRPNRAGLHRRDGTARRIESAVSIGSEHMN